MDKQNSNKTFLDYTTAMKQTFFSIIEKLEVAENCKFCSTSSELKLVRTDINILFIPSGTS